MLFVLCGADTLVRQLSGALKGKLPRLRPAAPSLVIPNGLRPAPAARNACGICFSINVFHNAVPLPTHTVSPPAPHFPQATGSAAFPPPPDPRAPTGRPSAPCTPPTSGQHLLRPSP